MTATNTPIEAPAENKGLMSKMVEGAKGLISDVKGAAGAVMVTAVAVTGAATENAEGATILKGTGLSNSSISGPVFIPGGSPTAANVPLLSLSGAYNSRLADSTPRTTDTCIDKFTVTLAAADVGLYGGTLTITGTLQAGTGSLDGSSQGLGVLGGGATFQVIQKADFGLQGGPKTLLKILDSGVRVNAGSSSFTTTEPWSATENFTYNMPIAQSGIFELQNIMTRYNSTGNAQFSSFSMNYVQNIPEPGAPLLVGIAGSLGLLRRKRNDTETTNTSAS